MNKYATAEAVLRALVKSEGVHGLAVALNNAFCHGDVIKENYGHVTQGDLDLIFAGIEKFRAASESIG